MRLGHRLLLIFASVVFVGMAIVYFISQPLLLSHFQQLEKAQTEQNVESALAALNESSHSLGATTSDYAYWDLMYGSMADLRTDRISAEFQNGTMEGLGLNLIVIRDLSGKSFFAKAYDTQSRRETRVPAQFLEAVFEKPKMRPASVALMPLDGILEFPEGPYLVSVRPILNSERGGDSRGVLLLARRFDDDRKAQLSDITRTSLEFARIGPEALPGDFQSALQALQEHPDQTEERPIRNDRIGGYALVPDIFGAPLFVLRVDTPRPIHARGIQTQRYIFTAMLSCAILSSAIILLFVQRYVVSRVRKLGETVKSIGERKALSERVDATGKDELSTLARSINGMLEDLEESQSQFLFLTENIHQVFWVRHPQTGAFLYISRAFERIYGRSRQTLVADPRSWQELVLPQDRSVIKRMEDSHTSGKPTELYFRIKSEDGALRWLWQRSFPSYGPDNKLKQIIGLTEDITDFKRNEEALLQSHEELEQRVLDRTAQLAERSELIKLLVDSTPGAIYGVDAEGTCTFCNAECLRQLGFAKPEELLGRNIHDAIHHAHADGTPYAQIDCPILASFTNGKDVHVVDEVFWKKGGTPFPVEYSSRQIRRHGEIVGAVVSFTDITNRKRKEMEVRYSQKLEAVGRLAAGIAHEINTPVQFVGDNTRFLLQAFQDGQKLGHKYRELFAAARSGAVSQELLDDVARTRQETDWDFLEEEIPRAIGQMLEGLNRMASIVRGMKEFSHVDRTNEKAPSDLNRALESTLIVARNELKYLADVETHYGELPPVVCHLGDLNQVFLNLLVNAAHTIEDANKGTGRKGKITVCTRQDGDWVEVSIADTGLGIPQELREKVFDPFFTTKEVGRGTGQGLALARAIVVERHGGTLTFDTEIGKGTTFYVRLPLTGSPMREEALIS